MSPEPRPNPVCSCETEPNCGSSSAPASLVTLETSDDLLAIQSAAQHRLHRRDWQVRKRVLDALLAIPGPRWRKQAKRMADCCSGTRIAIREKQKPVLILDSCKHRLCPVCSRKRSWRCGREIERIAKEMDSPRFITLTISTDDHTLDEAVSKLRSGWKRLRQTKFWKSIAVGGVYSLEVTRGKSGKRWHPHLHILVDGSFVPQKQLSEVWLQSTGDSCIVDVRAIRSRRQVARYISKYVSKGDTFKNWTQAQISEYAEAMCGQRTVQTFGSLHGSNPDPKEPCEIDGRHHRCVSWGRLQKYARASWTPACVVLQYAPRLGVDWRVLTNRDDDRDPSTRLPLVGPELRELNEALAKVTERARWEVDHPGRCWLEHQLAIERERERRRRSNAQGSLYDRLGSDAGSREEAANG